MNLCKQVSLLPLTLAALFSLSAKVQAEKDLNYTILEYFGGNYEIDEYQDLDEFKPIQFDGLSLSKTFDISEAIDVDLYALIKKQADGDTSLDYSGSIKFKNIMTRYSSSDFNYTIENPLNSNQTEFILSDHLGFHSWDQPATSEFGETQTIKKESFTLILETVTDRNAKDWYVIFNIARPYFSYQKLSGVMPVYISADTYYGEVLGLNGINLERVYMDSSLSGFAVGVEIDYFDMFQRYGGLSEGIFFDFKAKLAVYSQWSFDSFNGNEYKNVKNYLESTTGFETNKGSNVLYGDETSLRLGLGYHWKNELLGNPSVMLGYGWDANYIGYPKTKKAGERQIELQPAMPFYENTYLYLRLAADF